MQKILCIVIPCYNEEKRLPITDFENFMTNNQNTLICFVNDGSTDRTLEVLKHLKSKFDDQVSIVSYDKNVGKGEAIRKAVSYCNNNLDHDYIAYLDADLSTSPEECLELSSYLDENITFVFGSRIMKIGSVIVRQQHRFLIGRIIATIISNILKLKVYDTQCGCKIFKRELSEIVFKNQFVSKWLFDVEIFNRIIMKYGRNRVLDKMLEVPLKRWIDTEDSKVKMTYFLKLWVDLYRINRICKAEKVAVTTN
jgi:glycosyltransferase involved in cell wall biosynthesis